MDKFISNKRLWILFALFMVPQCAMADAGTPLMWAAAGHLVIGNALIGFGEGLLLVWFFSVPKLRAILTMIAANYFSAWCGMLLLCSEMLQPLLDLNNAWRWLWIMVGVTYLMTLVLEWPFVAWCVRKQGGWRRSVRATLLTQSISYAVLFGWYYLASMTSLYTKVRVVEPRELSLPESVFVYYISASDGDVYKRRLAGAQPEKVFPLHSDQKNDRLLVVEGDHSRWNLVRSARRDDQAVLPILNALDLEAVPDCHPLRYDGTWFSCGDVPPLGSAKCSPWTFWAGFWAAEGLKATNRTTGERVQFAYETPFEAWIVRNAIQLPGDKVLFQFGEDQICVFDPESKKIALLWHGRGPVAVIPKAESH